MGRNIEPDSGGYGQFRGGLGHTAVWMIHGTTGIDYQCGCAGIRSKVLPNHGMYGAYPVPPDRSHAGRSEEICGKWLSGKSRDSVIVATKAANRQTKLCQRKHVRQVFRTESGRCFVQEPV